MAGYGQAETANIYLANEIERRYSSKGLHAISLHPGAIRSNLQVHVEDPGWNRPGVSRIEKSPPQGAATTVYAALSRDWHGKRGVFISNCAIMGPLKSLDPMDAQDEGYAPYAYDAASEGRLWKDSLKMVGLVDDQ